MEQEKLSKVFLRHLVMAIPWGIMVLLVLFIAAAGMKQPLKKAVGYGMRTAVHETADYVLESKNFVPAKQNMKEAIEFVALTASDEVKDFLHDPQVKKDLKEISQYSKK